MVQESPKPFCVIGAGPAGLAVCRALSQFGIPFECVERESDIGGNFNVANSRSSVYRSTHLLSSKTMSEFPDLPMPASYPPCPSHTLVLDYFREYARRFRLNEHISFNTSVERMEPHSDGWAIEFQNGIRKRYQGVAIANGHHWSPSFPAVNGKLHGKVMHAREYHSPEIFQNKRLLVVGGGNTACDIVADAVPVASRVYLSMRRPVHFLPKYSFGNPGDVTLRLMNRLKVPMFVQRFLSSLGARVVNGHPKTIGLRMPAERIFDANVTVSSIVPFHIRQGDVVVKPEIKVLEGNQVRFTDGTTEDIDIVVFATGYQLTFPFIDAAHLNCSGGVPDLYLRQFHPDRDDVAVVGMIHAAYGGSWPLMYLQAQLLARFWAARRQGCNIDWFHRLKAEPSPDLTGGYAKLAEKRQQLSVEPVRFSKHLHSLIRKFDQRCEIQPLEVNDDSQANIQRAA